MKNILLIGVGGTGSRAVDIFFKKYRELGKQNDNHITALVFDTDAGDINEIKEATPVVMTDTASVGTVCDRLGRARLREWFPCDDKAVRAQELLRGASQWRKKSYLAFLNLMNKPLTKAKFLGALERMVANPGAGCEIYVISSVAGGTGSGSFIPIALFAKRYLRKKLRKDPIVNAMIALPEIYENKQTPENKIKIFANAYAILRELNAINLVARNYNAGRTAQKKAPIKLRIGHPDDTNVGVLFDASDESFWTPEAAPFSQVFLLDKIPCIESIEAHDIVLANSLYAILCTDIGEAFDSEFSNHELLRSQNNGSNAIYAGISTSQIRFPVDSVLNYIAHKKTLDACDGEWLILHKAIENKIKEKEKAAKEQRCRLRLKEGEYAQIALEELASLEDKGGNNEFLEIIDRCATEHDPETGKPIYTETAVDKYFEKIVENISKKITDLQGTEDELVSTFNLKKGAKCQPNAMTGKYNTAYEQLLAYFIKCIQDIKGSATSLADSILTLDAKKQDYAESDWSIVKNILSKPGENGGYLHPVAAFVQLCRLRVLINNKIQEMGGYTAWPEITERFVERIQPALCNISTDNVDNDDTNGKKSDIKYNRSKSYYDRLGESRFNSFASSETRNAYIKSKTNVVADIMVLKGDALSILKKINWAAQNQLVAKVLLLVAEQLDILISKYRSFFIRFDKEKEELRESTKSSERIDVGIVDSVINVYSSVEEKREILAQVMSDGGPSTEAEVRTVDNIIGVGVFESAYKSAIAAYSNTKNWNDNDSGAYKSLFDNMVNVYKKFIGKSEEFLKIASKNVVELMFESYNKDNIEAKFTEDFAMAQKLATPSLMVNENGDLTDLVRPSTIIVYMLSYETARYIKKHADDFNLHLPADQTNEKNVISACTEEFIQRYSGNSGARIAIVNSIPDQVIYCTGEIMDVSHLRISKFDEMGEDNIYYRHYATALYNLKKYDSDMWNPHLGNGFHKRGFLPYMNELKEKDCDVQVVKALLYALSQNLITYSRSVRENDKYYFEFENNRIRTKNGGYINWKNLAQLIVWLRDEDDKVLVWSKEFDDVIAEECKKLHVVTSDTGTQIGQLETSITKSSFIQYLTSNALYEDPAFGDKKGPTIFEFANQVKCSEELGCDCDDAERIVIIADSIFKLICGAHADMKNNPDRFILVYNQQLDKIYEALASARFIIDAKRDCRDQYSAFLAWLHQSHAFDAISNDADDNEVAIININARYNIASNQKITNILDKIAGTKVEEAASSEDDSDDV